MRSLEELLLKQQSERSTSNPGNTTTLAVEQSQHNGPSQATPPSTIEESETIEVEHAVNTNNPPVGPAPIDGDELQSPRVQSVCTNSSPLSTVSNDRVLTHILSTQGHWTYDDSTGRLRYFGPTTNFHIYSTLSNWAHSLDCRDQQRYGLSILRDIPQETQDYLLDLYWTYYNCVLFVVHREAFLSDMKEGRNAHYSAFLHLTLLAMGMRFADTSLPHVSGLLLGSGRESRIQREARRLVEFESASPGGLPSIQALLILGDLECATGRDGTGWMYSGR